MSLRLFLGRVAKPLNVRRAPALLLVVIAFAACSSISGQKYDDKNGNGQKDSGEEGLSGWTMQLDLNGDGSAETTATTGSGGNYEFFPVPPGQHKVKEVQKEGYVQTQPSGGADHNLTISCEGDPEDGPWPPECNDPEDVDFGNFQLISISGHVFNDANNNGSKDGGEGPLQGWVVQLDTGADGSVQSEATTDGSGNYQFTGVGPGTHRVREVVQSGFTQTTSNPTDVSAVSGTNISGVEFGNYQAPAAAAQPAAQASPASFKPKPRPKSTVAAEPLARTGGWTSLGWVLLASGILCGAAAGFGRRAADPRP